MTRLIFVMTLIAMLFLGSVSVLAQETPEQEEQGLILNTLTTLRQVELCADLQHLASTFSSAREHGVAYEDIYPDYLVDGLNEESQIIVTEIFEILYQRPFADNEMQQAVRWIRYGCLRGLY